MSATVPLVVYDLYSCAGGATKGYQRAGLYAVGGDRKPRINYCGDEFRKGDALDMLADLVNRGVIWTDAFGWVRPAIIHTSPPCQAQNPLTTGTNRSRGWGRKHVQLVPPTRELLDATGIPYVVEQPQGHGGLIRTDLRLCMDMFPIGEPPWVQRHRDFEISGFTVPQPPHPKGPVKGHQGYVRGHRHGIVRGGRDAPYIAAYGDGGGKATEGEMQHALGIDWTDVREELTEAIPPAYTEYIGRSFLDSLAAQGRLNGVAS